jgi:hypothetical protein
VKSQKDKKIFKKKNIQNLIIVIKIKEPKNIIKKIIIVKRLLSRNILLLIFIKKLKILFEKSDN